MDKTGYALLDGDKSMLLVTITAPDQGGSEKVVRVPPQVSRVYTSVLIRNYAGE